jgi:two-component system, cell cycle sensor histidine kinase and response regulator CckA
MTARTILVVDDESHIRALLRSVLERERYRVLEAGDGQQALGICTEPDTAIDLLLTDIVMPNLDGIQLVEKVLQVRPQVRVLYMSGKCDVEVVQRHMREKGCGFLRKPFAIDVLVRSVRELLEAGQRKGARRQEAPPAASSLSG